MKDKAAQYRLESKQRQFGVAPGSSQHITLTIPRTLKGNEVDYTYYQAVCSCGWHGVYRVSKLTAQEDKCPDK